MRLDTWVGQEVPQTNTQINGHVAQLEVGQLSDSIPGIYPVLQVLESCR